VPSSFDDGPFRRSLSLNPRLREGQIPLIHLDAGERLHTEEFRRHRRGADAEKGVEQAGFRAFTVELEALLDEADGKGGGMRPVFVA
jgi:hypothetical protein